MHSVLAESRSDETDTLLYEEYIYFLPTPQYNVVLMAQNRN